MGRIGISSQDVVNAIHELQGLNKNPTVDNVRSVLQTGSKTTIARHLKEWRQSEDITNADSAANALPEELLSLVKGLWQHMLEKTEQQVQVIISDYNAKEIKLQEELTSSSHESKQQETRIHTLEEGLHAQQQDNANLRQNIQHNLNEQAKLTERSHSLKTRITETQDEQAKLHEHFKQTQQNLEHYQQSEQKLKETQSLQLDNIKNQYETKINELNNELFIETSKNQKLHLELDNSQNKLQDSQHKVLRLETNAKLLEKIAIKYDILKENYTNNEKKLNKTEEQINSHKQDSHRLTIQCQQLKEQQETADIKLTQAEDEIESLRNEKNIISQEKANLAGQLAQL